MTGMELLELRELPVHPGEVLEMGRIIIIARKKSLQPKSPVLLKPQSKHLLPEVTRILYTIC